MGKRKKARTCRQAARRQYLAAAQSKRMTYSKRRKVLRKQLGYLKRNLIIIARQSRQSSLLPLTRKQSKDLLVIHEIYRRQQLMFDRQVNRSDDRIVSLAQPHVRPVKRGKAGAKTEFGAKVPVSLVDGFAFVDRISWDNHNEAGDLKGRIEAYRSRFNCCPESVHADKTYRNRSNRKFCRKHGIRLSGPPLGRPPKRVDPVRRALARQDELVERTPIEGKFGQGKRRFGLAKIMCKPAATSETAIGMVFLVMNAERRLKAVLLILFGGVNGRVKRFFGRSVEILSCRRQNANAFRRTKIVA